MEPGAGDKVDLEKLEEMRSSFRETAARLILASKRPEEYLKLIGQAKRENNSLENEVKRLKDIRQELERQNKIALLTFKQLKSFEESKNEIEKKNLEDKKAHLTILNNQINDHEKNIKMLNDEAESDETSVNRIEAEVQAIFQKMRDLNSLILDPFFEGVRQKGIHIINHIGRVEEKKKPIKMAEFANDWSRAKYDKFKETSFDLGLSYPSGPGDDDANDDKGSLDLSAAQLRSRLEELKRRLEFKKKDYESSILVRSVLDMKKRETPRFLDDINKTIATVKRQKSDDGSDLAYVQTQ